MEMTTRTQVVHMPDTLTPLRPVHDLKDLVAWQVAMDFAESVYRSTRAFPKDETFGMRLQLRRAAVSVPSNLAEGHGRIARREYSRFVLIARGSLKEAETQIRLAQRLGFLTPDAAETLLEMSQRLNRLLTALKNKLRS